MKSLITALALAVSFPMAMAQQRVNIPLTCAKVADADKVIKEYKEQPIFIGKDTLHGIEQLNVSTFLNAQTRTYTIMFIIPQNDMVCIISSGESGKVIFNQ